jgi:MFS family permease
MAQPDTPQAAKKDKKALSPEDRRMHIQLALLSLATMINVLGFSIIIPLIPEYVRQGLHMSEAAARQNPIIGEYGGWLTAIYALMQFLFAPFWGRLSDKIGRKPILVGSLIGDAVFYAMFGLSTQHIGWQFAARILAGIFSSATLSVAQAYAADITPPHLRAMGMGYLGASFGVGFILGPARGYPRRYTFPVFSRWSTSSISSNICRSRLNIRPMPKLWTRLPGRLPPLAAESV